MPISYGAVTSFDSGRLPWTIMIFKKNPLSFHHRAWYVYNPYEYVPISYGAVTFFDSGRLLWRRMIFELNPLSFSS